MLELVRRAARLTTARKLERDGSPACQHDIFRHV